MFRAAIVAGAVFLASGIFTRRHEEALPSAALVPRPAQDLPAQELEVRLALEPVRAAVYLSYRQKGLGEVWISNRGSTPLEGLVLKLELPGKAALLPEPLLMRVATIEPGAAASVRVKPRFTQAILAEPTSELLFSAAVLSEGREVASKEALVPLLGPSEMTWDVPERLAAVIDPQGVARLVRGAIASAPRSPELLPIRNLFLAAQVFDALTAWGFTYLEDSPASLAGALLQRPVDRVGHPAQTLRDHAGDCDDLTVLLASALEAAGVASAIAIFEDHLFPLFDIGLPPHRLADAAVDAGGVLERGGRAWVPVEATRLARPKCTLLSAWNAARLRLPGLRAGEGRMFEVRAAWSEFPAMTWPVAAPITVPITVPITAPITVPGPGSILFPSASPLPGEGWEPTSGPFPKEAGASTRELTVMIQAETYHRAMRALAAGTEPGEGERRAAAVLASAGFRAEALELLRHSLRLRSDPGARLELAAALLAEPHGPEDLAEARRELEEALRGWDPLDLAARRETLKLLSIVHRLEGHPRAAEEALLQEAALFATPTRGAEGL